MSMETDHGPDQEPEKYSFLQEKIKDEAFSRKKVLYKISWLVGKGLLFGVAASIGFFALKPWAESTFQKNPDKIEIPKDEDTQNTPSEDTQTTQEEFTIEKYKELNSLLPSGSTQEVYRAQQLLPFLLLLLPGPDMLKTDLPK